MELLEYLSIIKKRIAIIIIITLTATISSAAVSFLYLKNVYESTTTLYTGKLAQSTVTAMLQELQAGQTVIKDYREIVKSRLVVEEAKKVLESEGESNYNLRKAIELPYESFAEKIFVGLRNDTRIMEIKVSDGDPEVCTIIANSVANVFMEKVETLTKLENVQVIDKAVVPIKPVKPNKKMNVMVAFFVGLMASLGLVFLFEYFDNTIKTNEDIVKYLELPVLGLVPEFDNENTTTGQQKKLNKSGK